MSANISWNSPDIVRDGLVLYLDAGTSNSYNRYSSAGIWKDMSGNGNSGSLVNGPGFNSGNGGSIVFDGVDDYINCGNISNSILLNNQFTINYWLIMIGENRGDFFNIKNFNSLQDDIGFIIGTDNKIQVFVKIQNTTTNNISGRASISTSTLSRNTIYNICCMKDENQKIVIYINGVLDNNTYSTTTDTSTASTTPLWIGSNKTTITNPVFSWPGQIYSAQIYNRALSAQEVLQNYNATKGRFGL